MGVHLTGTQLFFGFFIVIVQNCSSETYSYFLFLDSKSNVKTNSCWHNTIMSFFSVSLVLALCKELGLDEDDSLAPVPKRRKAKSSGIALEEKISSALPHSELGTSTSKNITKQQEAKAQVFFSAKVSEDRQSGQTPLQFDKTTVCPSRTELKSLDENRTSSEDTIDQSNSGSMPEGNLGGTLEDRTDAIPENNCDHFMDRETTLHRPGSSERLSSLEERSSQGSVGGELPVNRTGFNVPPSPGHIEPLPDKLSQVHHLLQNGEPLSKVLKF